MPQFAVCDNSGSAKDSGKGFEKGGRADQRELFGIGLEGFTDRDQITHAAITIGSSPASSV
jgi:hypothetical protein